jgi:hypothetical protein
VILHAGAATQVAQRCDRHSHSRSIQAVEPGRLAPFRAVPWSRTPRRSSGILPSREVVGFWASRVQATVFIGQMIAVVCRGCVSG